MKLLEKKIIEEGYVVDNDILKVDNFLNHQLDINFLNEVGKEFKEIFKDIKVDRILTVEASGIAIACVAAQYFNVPVVFAKKIESKNLDKDVYESEVYSFTKAKSYKVRISKRYIKSGENILVLDDFLANGRVAIGLKEIIDQAKANLVGVGIVIEKGFQEGGEILRSMGINLESLAIIESMEEGRIKFKEKGRTKNV